MRLMKGDKVCGSLGRRSMIEEVEMSVVVWLFCARILERWKHGYMCPMASHGNMTMERGLLFLSAMDGLLLF